MNQLEQLLGIDLTAVFQRLGDIVRDPAADPKTTVLLIAIVSLATLIALGLAILFILSRPDEDEDGYYDELTGIESAPPREQVVVVLLEAEAVEVAPRRRSVAAGSAFAIGLVLVLWIATGVVSSQPSTCTSCHVDSPHSHPLGADAHKSVSCVSCHEQGGTMGSVTYMVGPRAIHLIAQSVKPGALDGYSQSVTSAACEGCHKTVSTTTVTSAEFGVKVSHKEPLAAGAECVDCHKLSSGVVSAKTVGMAPCLRCHNGKQAASGCSTCHVSDIGLAVRPASAEATVGASPGVIDTPNCYACHQSRTCDSCHGIRMPHTTQFIIHGHARAAAIDFWTNGGRTCSKCHTATRRPCSKCHGPMPSHGIGWKTQHQYGDPKSCSQGCHGTKTGGGAARTICEFCHDKPIKPRGAAGSVTTTAQP